MQKKRRSLFVRKVLAIVVSMVLSLGIIPASAFAEEGNPVGQPDYATLIQSEVITKQEAINLAKALVTSAVKRDPASAAQAVLTWGSGKLISQLFGDTGEEKQATLEDVLAAIDQLSTAISELQATMDSQQLDQILNDLKKLFSNQASYDVYAALKEINDKQEAGTMSDAEAKQRVQGALTTSLHNGRLNDIYSLADVADQSSFDHFAELLWYAMAVPYHVTISGNTHDYTLMQVWYDHLRYKYHWEHQAYDEWAAFQAQSVTLLAITLGLEASSLMTRIELIQNWNKEHPEQIVGDEACKNRLKTVQDRINQMSGYEGKGINGEDVFYPGLFSENTWNNAYWMFKVRDESERYYWTPGHEAVFFAQVNTQDIPPENDNAGLGEERKNDGIGVQWTDKSWLIYSAWISNVKHWKSFLHYSGPGSNGSDLVSADQLKDMYKDYKNDKSKSHHHLYDIFIDPKEGNFIGLEEGDISTWWFVVDPDSDHEVYFDKNPWPAVKGTARCYVLSSAHAETDTATLETYTEASAWRNKSRHFIGIGVKRYGPETYPYSAIVPKEDSEHHTGVKSDSAMWWPSCGDLTIGYDREAQGSVVLAEMDGVTIDGTNYSVSDNQLILTEAYMKGLAFGKHNLKLTCENGSHTVSFRIKQAQNISVKQTSFNKTIGDREFNLGAKTDGDGELTYRSSDEDVAMVGSKGKVIVRKAGTAQITILASETEEYAGAAAKVTVRVAGAKKAANTLKISPKTAAVAYSKLNKKAQTLPVTRVIKFTKKGQGKMSYALSSAKKGSKSFKKYFKINKKTGKVTVKKGLKKGTYKVKVKVKAAGNANYKASAVKTISFKIKVA